MGNVSKLKIGTDVYNVKDVLARTQISEVNNSVNKIDLEPKRSMYIAHRGAFYNAPENTIPAFEKAGELGYELVECDVFFSSDGIPVVHHDATVDRMTNGTGAIQSKTLAQIKSLKVDSGNNIGMYTNVGVPTLEEFLDVCNKWLMKPIIEVKGTITNANMQTLINIVIDKRMENLAVISSLVLSHLTQVRYFNDNITVEYCPANYTPGDVDIAVGLGNAMLGLMFSQITKAVVDKCEANGIRVNGWTVNGYDDARRLEKLGVYSIYTDTII